MKKNYLKLMAYMFAAIVCGGFVSCGDDGKDSSNSSETPINPVEPSQDNAMTPVEQKEYLEKVALEFMDLMPASDFQDISDLGKYISKNYVQDYDWSKVEGWAKDVFEASREALGTQTMESETEKWGNYTYKYNYIYTNYKALLLASNFKGHFIASNGQWVQESANDLQFIFADKRGQQCIVKLETGGNVKNVYVLNIDTWQNSDNSSNGYTYTYDRYYDRTQCIIGVPERINVTLTQGGSQVINTIVKIDLGNIVGEEFDISKNSLTVSALVELNNGYKFDISKVAYNGNVNASVSFAMKKNDTALVSMGASGEVNGLPSVNVNAYSSKNFNSKDYDLDNVNGKNTFVKLDIMGKIQIQGTLVDVRKYLDYLNEAEDNNMDEKTYKSYINLANSLADINLFYDGKNVKQAALKLEPFANQSWSGSTRWEAEPVICFFDGSSYSTFEAFFNEKDFKKVVDTFKTLTDKYADLID